MKEKGEEYEGEKEYHDVDTMVKDHQKETLVHILIDKTGLGQNIEFDPDDLNNFQHFSYFLTKNIVFFIIIN